MFAHRPPTKNDHPSQLLVTSSTLARDRKQCRAGKASTLYVGRIVDANRRKRHSCGSAAKRVYDQNAPEQNSDRTLEMQMEGSSMRFTAKMPQQRWNLIEAGPMITAASGDF